MSLSSNNINFQNLESYRTYIGKYDDLHAFGSVVVTITCDRSTQLTFYQSQNKTITTKTVYNQLAGLSTVYLDITQPYGYFTLENTGLTTSSICHFTVMYRAAENDAISSAVVFNASILNNGPSSIIKNTKSSKMSVFGNSSVAGSLVLQFSSDGYTFYDSQYAYTLSTAGDFGYTQTIACRYVRLRWVGDTSIIHAEISLI